MVEAEEEAEDETEEAEEVEPLSTAGADGEAGGAGRVAMSKEGASDSTKEGTVLDAEELGGPICITTSSSLSTAAGSATLVFSTFKVLCDAETSLSSVALWMRAKRSIQPANFGCSTAEC